MRQDAWILYKSNTAWVSKILFINVSHGYVSLLTLDVNILFYLIIYCITHGGQASMKSGDYIRVACEFAYWGKM